MTSRVRAILIDDGYILLGLNKKNEYMLPGGKLHKGEHPVDGILREVYEETGIKGFKSLHYLFAHEDNQVFLFCPQDYKPTTENDPDKEFLQLDWFHVNEELPATNKFAVGILEKFRGSLHKTEAVTEVLVDGEKVYEIPDDEIWETSPGLVQKKLNDGREVEFRQILPDGEVVDQTPHAMPETFEVGASGNSERATQMKKIYDTIDEILLQYIPEQMNRPSAEILYNVDYLGKCTWQKIGDKSRTHITVNHKIIHDDSLLRQVLAHEVIHHHLYHEFENEVEVHGEMFQMFADMINAKEGENFIHQYANHTEFRTNSSLDDKVLDFIEMM